jgi:hypothetical protein
LLLVLRAWVLVVLLPLALVPQALVLLLLLLPPAPSVPSQQQPAHIQNPVHTQTLHSRNRLACHQPVAHRPQ